MGKYNIGKICTCEIKTNIFLRNNWRRWKYTLVYNIRIKKKKKKSSAFEKKGKANDETTFINWSGLRQKKKKNLTPWSRPPLIQLLLFMSYLPWPLSTLTLDAFSFKQILRTFNLRNSFFENRPRLKSLTQRVSQSLFIDEKSLVPAIEGRGKIFSRCI